MRRIQSRYLIFLILIFCGSSIPMSWSKKSQKEVEVIEVSESDYKKLKEARSSGGEGDFELVAAEILGKDQNDLKALNGLALYHLSKNRVGLAKLILNRALKAHPDNAGLHNNLGVLLLREGELQLAVRQFKKSLKMSSDYDFGAWNLGSLLLTYRDYKKSMDPLENAYRRAKTRLDDNDRVAFEIASNFAIARAGSKEIEAARKIFEKLINIDGRDVNTLFNYGILLVDLVKSNKDTNRIITKLRFLVEDAKLMRMVDQLEKRADQLPSGQTNE